MIPCTWSLIWFWANATSLLGHLYASSTIWCLLHVPCVTKQGSDDGKFWTCTGNSDCVIDCYGLWVQFCIAIAWEMLQRKRYWLQQKRRGRQWGWGERGREWEGLVRESEMRELEGLGEGRGVSLRVGRRERELLERKNCYFQKSRVFYGLNGLFQSIKWTNILFY